MTAQLVSIILDQRTENYLQNEMSRNEADEEALALLSTFGDLSETPVWLNKLPEGEYT